MSKSYEITLTARVESEEDIEAWLKEHIQNTDKVNIEKWSIDLRKEFYTLKIARPEEKNDMDELLKALKKARASA